jgi:hypothetical protein
MSWNYFIRTVIHPLPFSEFIFILDSDLDPVNKMFRSPQISPRSALRKSDSPKGKGPSFAGGSVWPDIHGSMEADMRVA